MMFNNLCEQHLAHSNHASPSCIGNVGTDQLIRKLREATPISDPDSALEYFVYLSVDKLDIFLIGMEFGSQDVDLLMGFDDSFLIILLKKA